MEDPGFFGMVMAGINMKATAAVNSSKVKAQERFEQLDSEAKGRITLSSGQIGRQLTELNQ